MNKFERILGVLCAVRSKLGTGGAEALYKRGGWSPVQGVPVWWGKCIMGNGYMELPCGENDRHDWNHYLLATSLMGGNCLEARNSEKSCSNRIEEPMILCISWRVELHVVLTFLIFLCFVRVLKPESWKHSQLVQLNSINLHEQMGMNAYISCFEINLISRHVRYLVGTNG